MKEIYDSKTGAILFKDDEKDPLDKRVRILEKKLRDLTIEVNKLKNIIDNTKQ